MLSRMSLVGLIVALSATAVAAEERGGGKSIGLMLKIWDPALYETPDGKAECPDGMQFTNRDNWKLQFPTQEEQDEFTRRHIHLGPSAPGGLHAEVFLQNRGPQGQNVAYNPTVVKDALPLREVHGNIAYGLNLDDDETGKATANTCAHENFVTPEGERGIDNQLYRIIGCSPGWRGDGINKIFHRAQVLQEQLNRILIEITEVDDEQNDDHVVVTTYKGVDRVRLDVRSEPIANVAYRPDMRMPQYIARTTGKIVDGTLITDPVDWRSPMHLMNGDGERLLYRARMKLKLSETEATGLVGGYEDLGLWYSTYVRGYGPLTDSISFWSPPAFYEGALRHADGNPDPETGQCTAISAAYQVTFIRVNVVRAPPYDPVEIDARRLQTAGVNEPGKNKP